MSDNEVEGAGSAALYERRGHVGILTLNRPDAMNAVNSALSAAAGAALEAAQRDPEVRAAGTALAVAVELAEKIAGNAPVAVQESKRVAHESHAAGTDWGAEVWEINRSASRIIFRSRDAQEGARAFAEKRTPNWQGC